MDAASFQQQAMLHERLLYRLSYSMLRNNDDCADAVQETLLRAWQNREHLKNPGAFKAWLCRILVNTCKDMLRKKSRVQQVELNEELAADDTNDQRTFLLNEALSQLPPEQRSAVILHYLEGWSVWEIAQTFDLPAGTVKTRLMYARKHLSKVLSEEV